MADGARSLTAGTPAVDLPAVDVVVPVRDGARWIVGAIDTVRGQRGVRTRVLVVDDGSSDDTGALAEAASGPDLVLIREGALGLSAARNRGIAAATAEWVAFLDCDDRWEPDKLSRVIARCEEEQSAWGFSSARIVDEMGAERGMLLAPTVRSVEDLLMGNRVPSPSSVVMRRSLLDETGGFDERLDSAEDWDMWIRVASVTPPSVLTEPLVRYTVHAENLSKDVRRMEEGVSAVLAKHARVYPPRLLRRARSEMARRLGTEARVTRRPRMAFAYCMRSLRLWPGNPEALRLGVQLAADALLYRGDPGRGAR